MPQQKLDQFEILAGLAAQFCARPPQIVGRQVLDANLVRAMQHDFPDRGGAKRGVRHLVIFSYRPKYLPLRGANLFPGGSCTRCGPAPFTAHYFNS